jgi:hypothetical protein
VGDVRIYGLTMQLILLDAARKRSPHFSGLWEAAVKSAKRILNNILLHTPVTIEELSTFIIEVESILNSRPLSPLSTDPSDLQVLTPGHFLFRTFSCHPGAQCHRSFNLNCNIATSGKHQATTSILIRPYCRR